MLYYRIYNFFHRLKYPEIYHSKEFGNIKLYEINDNVYNYYRKHVRGNSRCSWMDIRKKLTRDILLSNLIHNSSKVRNYQYGNMIIFVNKKDNMIYYLENSHNKSDFQIDEVKKNKLNRILKIK